MEALLCTRCQQEKPVSEFHKARNNARGYDYWCRSCKSEYRRQYYQRNKDRESAWFREYYWQRREYHRERYRQWYERKHSEKCGPDCKCRKAVQARVEATEKRCSKCEKVKPKTEFYADDRRPDGLQVWCKDCFNAHVRQMYWANHEKELARGRAYRARPEAKAKALERQRRWRAENPEKAKEKVRRYQARKRGATVEPVDYEAIIKRDGLRCHICGKKIRSRKDLHFDHIIPLSKGGKHSMDNIACAHAACNLRKNDKVLPMQLKLAVDW